MAEVGVLNLTIKDNSEQAAQGLNKLADALSRVKNAVSSSAQLRSYADALTKITKAIESGANSYGTLGRLATSMEKVKSASQGFKLPDFSRLEALAKSLQENYNAESGLKRIAEGMEAVKKASEGFKMPNTKGLDKVIQAVGSNVEKTSQAEPEQQSAFVGIEGTIRDAREEMSQMSQEQKKLDFSVFDPSKLPIGSLGMTLRDVAENAGQMGDAVKDSFETIRSSGQMDSVKGLDAMEQREHGLILYNENIQNTWARICERMDEANQKTAEYNERLAAAAEQAEKIRKAQEEAFYSGDRRTYSLDETNAMADNLTQLDLLKAKLRDAELAYNKFVNVYGTSDTKTIKAGLAVSELRDKIWQLEQAAKEASEETKDQIEVPVSVSSDAQTVQEAASESAQLYSSTLQSILDGSYQAKEQNEGTFSSTLDSILDGTYEAKKSMEELNEETVDPKIVVDPILEAKTKLDLLKQQYEILRQELANGIVSGGFDDKKINAYSLKLVNLKDQIEKLQNQYDELNGSGGMSVMGDEAVQAANSFMEANDKISLFTMQLEALKAKLGEGILSGTMDETQISKTAQQIQNLQEKIDKLKESEEEAKTETISLKQQMAGLFSQMKTSVVGKLSSQFLNIAKRMAMRAVIKQITAAFGEGIENVYRYSKAVGTSFAPQMDNAASSLLQFKNSIGAAVAPLISSFIPVLQTVISWLIEGINYINQFFSLLNGQNTWTKAVYTQTDAYDKNTKSAKAASKAAKDLLADWDELNIIQSNSGGGGGGGSSGLAKDYSEMFEECADFGEDVKAIVKWIEEHMDLIRNAVIAIGAAILAWKISSAFGNSLNMLQTISVAAGVMLLISGIEISKSSGYDIGRYGLTGENLTNSIVGILESGIGGALIGVGLTRSVAGGAIGLYLGTVISLAILAYNIDKGSKDALYGDESYSAEEIQAEVDKLFTFDVTARYTQAKQDHESLEKAKKDILTDLYTASKKYLVLKLKPDAGTAAELAESVNALVQDANGLLEEYRTQIAVGFGFSANFDDPEMVQRFSSEQITGLDTYIKNLGSEIGGILEDGIVDGINEQEMLDDLLQKLENVAEAIARGRASGTFSSAMARAAYGMDFEKADRNSILQYMKTYQDEVKKVEETAYTRAADAKGTLAGIYSGMLAREQDNPGTYTFEELEEARLNYENYDVNAAIEQFVEESVADGRRIFLENMMKAFNGAISKLNTNGSWYSVGATTLTENNSNIRKWMEQNLGYSIGFGEYFGDETNQEFAKMLQEADVDVWDMLSEDMQKHYINAIEKALGIGPETYSRIKDELGLNAEDILLTKKGTWDKLSNAEQKEYITYLSKAYGGREVVEAFQNAGYTVEELLGAATKFKGNTQDSFVKALEEVFNVDIDLPTLTITDVQVDMDALKREIEAALSDGIMDTSEAFDLMMRYGINEYDEALRQLNYTLDENGRLVASLPIPWRTSASAGGSSVTYSNGSGSEYGAGTNKINTGGDVGTSVINYEQMAGSVKEGTKSANEGVIGELQTIVQKLNNLLAKEWKVVVAPNSTWGRNNVQSGNAWDKVTGG